MAFLDRPDRILKALPFITGKATWDAKGRANNASHSYPFNLWRTVTPAGQDPTNKTTVYAETHLHKWYDAWSQVDGDRFVVSSTDAELQVQGFRQTKAVGADLGAVTGGAQASVTGGAQASLQVWQVVANNLAFGAHDTKVVELEWSASAVASASSVVVSVKRLYWDEKTNTPMIETKNLTTTGGGLPSSLQLLPGELAVLSLTIVPHSVDMAGAAVVAAVDEHTHYSTRVLEPMATSKAVATTNPYAFTNIGSKIVYLRVRVGFGGPASSVATAPSNFAETAAALHIEVNGKACSVNATLQIAGPLHVNSKPPFTYFTALEVELSVESIPHVPSVTVLVWSDAPEAGNTTVSSVVLVVGTASPSVQIGH
jgi:hypothetical protein